MNERPVIVIVSIRKVWLQFKIVTHKMLQSDDVI